MKRYFTPRWTLNRIYDIQPEDLLRHGFKAVIMDLDNTLLAWNQAQYTSEMAQWVHDMQASGIQLYILSNNSEDRVAKVAQPLNILYKAQAMKPRRRPFFSAIETLGVAPEAVVMIGDQVMTDVLGANRVGIATVLVKPVAQNDIIYTRINRLIERGVLKLIGIDRTGDWGTQLD